MGKYSTELEAQFEANRQRDAKDLPTLATIEALVAGFNSIRDVLEEISDSLDTLAQAWKPEDSGDTEPV